MDQTVSGSSLSELRSEIDNIDDCIAELLAKRIKLVKTAAGLKSQSGEGVISADREASILEHGALLERKYELPQNFFQDILRRILRQSYKEKGQGSYTCAYKSVAEQSHDAKISTLESSVASDSSCATTNNSEQVSSNAADSLSGTQSNKQCTVVMVGGAGGMARLFKKYLEGSNYRVLTIEKDDYALDINGQKVDDMAQSKAAAFLAEADWCIVTVPIDVTEQVIATIALFLRSDCILSDFTSIKERPMQAMLKAHAGPVLGLHPMFGPDTESLVRQVIVAVEGRYIERCQFIIEQFKIYGALVIETGAQEHDQSMRVIQALRHFTTFAYGVFLRQTAGLLGEYDQSVSDSNKEATNTGVEASAGLPDALAHPESSQAAMQVSLLQKALQSDNSFLKRLLLLSSPIYHLELMMVGRLFAQDPHLYCDIISASDDNLKLIHRYLECSAVCLDMLEQGNKEKFVSEFESTSEFFGQYATLFLKESADILAKAQDSYPVKII